MARTSWILATGLIVAASAPIGCFFVGDDGNSGGPGGQNAGGTAAGYGTSTSSGAGPLADSCDPVTAAGCPSDGSTCDLNSDANSSTYGTFVCFNGPNTVDVCGACDASQGFYCGAELTCITSGNSSAGYCYRYCCTDADCGEGGSCSTELGAQALNPAIPSDKVGLCVATSAPYGTPACGVASPASGGSCVGGYTPAGADGGTTGDGGTTTGDGGATGDGGTTGDGGVTGDGGSTGDGGTGAGGATTDGGADSSSSSGGAGGAPASTTSGGGFPASHPPDPDAGTHAGR
jgi:hypothetical protein